MVITVMFNHPTYVTFCITHLFLFETMFSPFQPALYLKPLLKREVFPSKITTYPGWSFPSVELSSSWRVASSTANCRNVLCYRLSAR